MIKKHTTLGIDPTTGKRVRKRIYGKTEAEIAKQEKELVRQFARRKNPSNTIFKDYLDKWQHAYIDSKSYSTQRNFKCVRNHCEPLFPLRMVDITRIDLQNIINAHLDTPTICQLLCAKLKAIWESALADGIVDRNIAVGLIRPKVRRKEKRPLTQEELTAIKNANFTPQQRLMVDILLQFGLRPGEAFALNSASIDAEKRLLIINKALAHKDQMPIIKSTKTGVTRKLPIPDSMMEELSAQKGFFFTQDGNLCTRWGMSRFQIDTIRAINEALGSESGLTFYNFRHNKASLLYYLPGVSIKAKAAYMGHSEAMFLKTYSHMMEEKEDMEILRSVL